MDKSDSAYTSTLMLGLPRVFFDVKADNQEL